MTEKPELVFFVEQHGRCCCRCVSVGTKAVEIFELCLREESRREYMWSTSHIVPWNTTFRPTQTTNRLSFIDQKNLKTPNTTVVYTTCLSLRLCLCFSFPVDVLGRIKKRIRSFASEFYAKTRNQYELTIEFEKEVTKLSGKYSLVLLRCLPQKVDKCTDSRLSHVV